VLTEGTISNWRFDKSLLLRLTFHAPNLTVEHGSQRQQVLSADVVNGETNSTKSVGNALAKRA
jgi:hypothetical protein